MRAKAISLSFSALMLTAAASGQNVGEVVTMKQDTVVFSLAFSPDGRSLASGGYGMGETRIWEVPSGREIARIKPDVASRLAPTSLASFGIAFSLDGKYLATGNVDGATRIWEVESGRLATRATAAHAKGQQVVPYPFAFSPDGRLLATGSDDGNVRVWEVNTGREVARMTHEKAVMEGVAFSPDGRHLATVENDTVRVWEVSTAQQVAQMKHQDIIMKVAFSPDGRLLATSDISISDFSTPPSVRLWDTTTCKEIKRFPETSGSHVLIFSPDGRYLAVGTWGELQVWEVASGQKLAQVGKQHSVGYLSNYYGPPQAAFSPDGRYIVTASPNDRRARVTEAATGRAVAVLEHKKRVYAVAFSPAGRYLATADSDRRGKRGESNIKLWSFGQPAPNVNPSGPAAGVARPELPPGPTPRAGQWVETGGPGETIFSAKTVMVVGMFGELVTRPRRWDGVRANADPGPAKAKKQVEKVIQKWGRFSLVEDHAQADLVLVITESIFNKTYDDEDGERTERVLADRLLVFMGGKPLEPDATPLWDSGEIEFGITGFFKQPPVRTVDRFRKFVEALEKDAGK